MDNRSYFNKPIVAVLVAVVLVLLLVVTVFLLDRPKAGRVEITLPEQQFETENEAEGPLVLEDDLLQITPENAEEALLSLNKPQNYHQTYSVSIGTENDAVYQVELWVKGSYKRAEVTHGQDTKIILSDGRIVHIWYASDNRVRSVMPGEEVTFEDLIGLPGFDYMQTLHSIEVTDAEYLVVDDTKTQVPCIFLSLKQSPVSLIRYWIDLTSGLLYRADCVEDNEQVYQVNQSNFDRLAYEDEIFFEKFLLPDGTEAFTA